MQRNLCNFPSREISTKQNWRYICTSKPVKRNLYQKMFENAFLPKSLRRHLQQRIWEEKSKGTNLSRKKVTKSLKRNLYQNNPPDPSRDISKISLKRHFYQTSIWEVFFFRNTIPKEPHRGFSTKLYSRKKRLPKNSSEIVTAKNLKMDLYSKNLSRKNSEEKFLQQIFEYKNQPNKNVWTKKHEKESLQEKIIWTEIIYPKKPEDKSLPKNTLKRNLYETVSQDKFTQKKLFRLYQKTLSTKEIQRNSLPKNWKIYPIQFLPKRSLPKKIKRPWIWFFKMLYPIKVSSKFRWSFDSASRSFIETSMKLRFDQSKFHRNFNETSIPPVEVSMKLRFYQSKFRWNFDSTSRSFIEVSTPKSKFHRSFDSKIETSIKLRFWSRNFYQTSILESKLLRNFDFGVEVSSKLRLVESKFHRNFDWSIGRIEVSSKFRWNFDWTNRSFIEIWMKLRSDKSYLSGKKTKISGLLQKFLVETFLGEMFLGIPFSFFIGKEFLFTEFCWYIFSEFFW